MISQVDSGDEFAEFLKVIETQKASAAKANDESDTIEAFVALGGNSDKSGEFPTREENGEVVKVRINFHRFLLYLIHARLASTFQTHTSSPHLLLRFLPHPQDFGLTIDIEKLIQETDTDNSKIDCFWIQSQMCTSESSLSGALTETPSASRAPLVCRRARTQDERGASAARMTSANAMGVIHKHFVNT